ncbi:helix-turn-helix domain-containing protein, partial [Lactobacillus halodurans]|nr:helix-turn-helix domain-containing protein [Companilactobacillus halodurans]
QGKSISTIAREIGITRQTIYRIKNSRQKNIDINLYRC